MTPEETAVTEAMNTFKRQADECVTCLYAYLTIHAVAAKSRTIRDQINRNGYFWMTTLHALQTSLILALGRVFEANTPHNVTTFMRAVNQNRAAFSREALRARKTAVFGSNLAELDNYMAQAKIPRRSDFRRVADFVKKHKATYLSKYRAIRDQVFAHTLVVDGGEITALFSQTNIRELQRMTTYLGRLHDGVWEALNNGGHITVRPRRYSVAKILKRPKGRTVIAAIQERTVEHTKRAMQPWAAPVTHRLRRPR